ncbi:ROK family protein [Flagellimonas onchidii]|uniref:ROK family protein n=1 Tax=Flagellimonas onchidii TaxID=2562684 RepID=UPI0010A65E6A|nr:ROK family protein [Allomuricauda onchidii]
MGQNIEQNFAISKKNPLSGIAFAMPGPFDYANGVAKYPEGFKYGALYSIEIEKELSPLLNHEGVLPIRFLNDATSFAVGEAWLAESLGYQNQLCVTLGTGLCGNISKTYFCFGNELEQVFDQNELSVAIRISEHKEKGSIIGCTGLFGNNFWSNIKNNLPRI